MAREVGRERRATRTSSFGVGKRESHDSSEFYSRFVPPKLSRDEEVATCDVADTLFVGDSRDMVKVPEKSVSLVATSPPYHASKEYETDVNAGHVPSSYMAYLEMLHEVFAECHRVLEPGGRIAVNVANLGRKPFRSLSKDVWVVLEDLGFLPRGEIVWTKAAGSSGNCAWGSWRSPSNPSLRDLTERVLIASKGRFDRALHWKVRQQRGLPWESTIGREEFMAWTLDTWTIRAESARRVGHPAPFPVELPARLIQLYTFKGDVVLDPFMGAGTTAVAAVQADRRYVGFDMEEAYIDLAERRIAAAKKAIDGA